MRIGFDAKRLYCNFTGLGNYSRTILKNLKDFFPEHEYHLYTPEIRINPQTDYFLSGSGFHTFSPENKKLFWRSHGITNQLKQDRIQIYHGLSNELPANIRKANIKSVVTIHDLIFRIIPQTYPFIDRKIYNLKARYSCRNADTIIAISNNTKNDIIKFYDVDPEKISVVYQSCNPLFYKNENQYNTETIRKKYHLPHEYILSVGTIEKRKNLGLIIKSYQHLSPEMTLPLVVVGKAKKYIKEVIELIKSYHLENKVIWISQIEDIHDLQSIYQNAEMLVYPSLYEGFGLPVVEALLCRIPVITSNVSSMPEAGGPGSLYINPDDPEEVAGAIRKILESPSLKEKMIREGYSYAVKKFSPEITSHDLIKLYNNLIT